MASILVHTADESVTLTAEATRRLLERGSGDAALLYLALLRRHGTVQPRSLAGELRWDRPRIEQAEAVLRELGLIAPAGRELPPEPADERPAYRQDEIAAQLEQNPEFSNLVQAVEKLLGKRLNTPDTGMLLGLQDYLGLPADVIYLLVNHCLERVQRSLGQGRRPGMKQIEKEGYIWARKGIDNQASAAEYLKQYAERQAAIPQFMRVLQLGERQPSTSEGRYLTAWQEMGFGPDAVALAYDKTMLKCHELKWGYLNAILKNWHEKGIHTAEEAQEKEHPSQRRETQQPAGGDEAWKYV